MASHTPIATGELNGARVLFTAIVGLDTRPTGRTLHTVDGEELGPVQALAICEYPDGNGVYLFYCDAAGNILTDTWHMSIADAMAQAEFEYAGISEQWNNAA